MKKAYSRAFFFPIFSFFSVLTHTHTYTQLLKAEWEGCLEGAGNSFELKQLLKNAFTNVEEQLNDKKSQLNLKLQAEEV